MHIRFWGTRGSIPTPGKSTLRYGGNTSCIELRSKDVLIILDCGTGVRHLGDALAAQHHTPEHGNILIGHTHWDHIQGIPFFLPFFISNFSWDIYGPKGTQTTIQSALRGQMQSIYFPVRIDEFEASVKYHDLVEQQFEIGHIKITTHSLNHTTITLGYRFEAGGKVLVYSCDHEPFPSYLESGQKEILGKDLEHVEFIKDADILIHDSQYRPHEYPKKVGWGHSTPEYAIKIAELAGVKKLVLTHHEPLRSDSEITQVTKMLKEQLKSRGSKLKLVAAKEGMKIEI